MAPEGDSGGIALLERHNAWRMIAAEAVPHDRDALGIDVRAGGGVVIGRGAGHFVVVTTVDVAETQRLGLARPVDGKRVDPALGEVETREDHAHLLGVVHAVEQHDGRTPAAARALHEIGGQAGVLVGNLDALDRGMQAPHGGAYARNALWYIAIFSGPGGMKRSAL
jgi:hypothetical protein